MKYSSQINYIYPIKNILSDYLVILISSTNLLTYCAQSLFRKFTYAIWCCCIYNQYKSVNGYIRGTYWNQSSEFISIQAPYCIQLRSKDYTANSRRIVVALIRHDWFSSDFRDKSFQSIGNIGILNIVLFLFNY